MSGTEGRDKHIAATTPAETIGVALDHLLAQDRFEWPHVEAGRAALKELTDALTKVEWTAPYGSEAWKIARTALGKESYVAP